MRKVQKIYNFLPALLAFIFPSFVLAQVLVPACDGKGCDFTQLMTLVNNVISFALIKMALPIAAIMFAYAGFLLVTAGGEAAHAREKAKSIFTNAVFGLVIAVSSWLIIRTILQILGFDGTWIGF